MSARRRVALVRGPFLNAFECQSYAPLAGAYDVTAFASVRRLHAVDRLPFPVVELPAWPRPLRRVGALAADLAARARFGEGRYLPGLVERLRGFDIVHTVETAHGFSAQALEAHRRFGCQVVVTVWENLPFNRKGYSRHAFDVVRPQVLAGASAFVAVSERARDALVLEGADPARVRVIPMGVDLDRFRPTSSASAASALRHDLGLPGDAAVVLAVGGAAETKGLRFLLLAAARARRDPELADVPFVVVLVGRDVGDARGQVARLGLGDVVRLVDYVPYERVATLYQLAAVHVLASVPTPTWQEQFGMVLVESLGCGTPVIATVTGSIPEVVGDAGVLVPPADDAALHQALKALLRDPARRQALGVAGRRRAEERFDAERVAKQIAELYESLD